MLNPRRQSAMSPAPVSPSAIPRPHSVTGSHRPRLSSDAASQRASPEPDIRNVRVVLRVRPSNPDDTSVPPRYRNTLVHPTSSAEVRVDVDPATLIGAGAGPSASAASGSKRHPTFNFDSVLGETSSQEDLYDATSKDVVDEFLKGHNVTFLAYGQTSSGKSYSMGTSGEDADYAGTEFTPRTGLIPRTVSTIFERAEALRQSSGPGASWECRLSFLELYNEEIIDLLSGTGVSISIREERDGRIIWSGVREVKVRSLTEVMQYLYEGSARRKTGETGMNATSSRSHAIFSLTLVQKRKNLLVASASQPLSEVSTPTRQLKRPTSMIGMAAARSPTPSGTRSVVPPSSFSKGGPTMSRPNSFVGPNPSDTEYLVVTSKFNMVDLAGSERLKRTAAQGDRMKEGISINSGLLALGNVISTLADPIKARGHIPYRDSKLTRMLQDSIGGNALTTMIACVSPIEYNINETINTIKYASRARNIKNTAKINAVEAGWDDVEHLQALVTRLRRQLANLDGDGGSRAPSSTHRPDDGASEKLLSRLAELQREHTELYDRYLGKCSENMRLTSELRNANPGDGDALDKFNETVEPVILEYEKVVGALNQQLDELRAELTNISDLHEEQAAQLLEAQSRQTQNETYVAELRSRVAKLTERNTSGEAYIQDLEAKLKTHADKADSRGDVVADLRKEMTRFKEANDRLTQHTSEIETRLSKSEGHAAVLIAQIEKHEKETLEREQAYRDLEAHVALLDTSKDNKLLLESLAEKEQRISTLEQQLIDQTAGQSEREQLRQSVQVEKAAQAELRAKLAQLEVSAANSTRDTSLSFFDDVKEQLPNRSPVPTVKELTPPESPTSVRPTHNDDHVAQLEVALRELEARCAEAESKYSEAEHQIAELSTQLSEARLVHAELDDVMPISPGAPSPGVHDDTSDSGSMTLQTPRDSSRSSSPVRLATRRGSTPSMLTPLTGAVALKQRDFRHGRGSFGDSKRARPQSLSQELSSAQSLDSSPRASWTGPPSALRLAISPRNHRQSLPAAPMLKPLRSSSSLEAELRFVHEVVEKRDEELKDREAYIRQLEETLRSQHLIPSRNNSANSLRPAAKAQPPSAQPANGHTSSPLAENIPLPESPAVLTVELGEADADREIDEGDKGVRNVEHAIDKKLEVKVEDAEETSVAKVEGDSEMSPSSSQRFNDLKNTLSALASLDQNHTPDQEVQSRIDTLLREMAVKESSHRAIIEQQFVQIADLQKANNKLKDDLVERGSESSSSVSQFGTVSPLTPSKRPSLMTKSPSMSSVHSAFSPVSPTAALNRLREEHADELQAVLKAHAQSREEIRQEHAEAVETHLLALTQAQSTHASQLEVQRGSHEKTLADVQASHDTALLDLQTRHETALRELTASHDSAFADLKREHNLAIQALSQEQEALIEEMEKSLSASEEQRRQLKMKADQAAFEVSRVRDETAIQRSTAMKQLAELQKLNVQLEKSKTDLQVENEDLSRRITEIELRSPRKSTTIPPQGPPPRTPLPPLPSNFATPIALAKELSSDGTISSSTHRSTGSRGSHGSTATAPTSVENVGVAVAQLPEPVGQMVQKVLAERDAALASKKEMMAEAARAKDLEAELLEERVKAENLGRDLHDAKKMNSKMRAHLEDARNESKRLTEACQEHMGELNDRRMTMSTLSRETGQQRDSLVAANAQVAALKAQLDRAVEHKVNKKLNQRLKCF